MNVKRKKYSPQFKSQIVQQVLAGEKTLAQIAKAFDEQIEKALSQLKAQHEKEKEELYAQIGRLSTQLA